MGNLLETYRLDNNALLSRERGAGRHPELPDVVGGAGV